MSNPTFPQTATEVVAETPVATTSPGPVPYEQLFEDQDILPNPKTVDDPESPSGQSRVWYRANGIEHRREHVTLVNENGAPSVSAPDTVPPGLMPTGVLPAQDQSSVEQNLSSVTPGVTVEQTENTVTPAPAPTQRRAKATPAS